MKSKQINFYITQEDVDSLYQLVRSIGWCVVPSRLETEQVSVVDTNPLSAFFVLKHQLKDVRTKLIGTSNSYKVQISDSPAIEFWAPAIDAENQAIHRGRIYLTCEYFSGGQLVEKNSEFLNASKNLMLWIRKRLKSVKSDELGDVLISKNAQEWVEESHGKFVRNNILV